MLWLGLVFWWLVVVVSADTVPWPILNHPKLLGLTLSGLFPKPQSTKTTPFDGSHGFITQIFCFPYPIVMNYALKVEIHNFRSAEISYLNF
eukprot:gene27145-biopygen6902